jgi:diaminopimelate epimerase
MARMRFDFVKCHGSGTDFPLIDARGIALSDAEWAGVARALADRAGPVGGDGLLLLALGRDGAAFSMRMFNSDGAEAETCLTGLRCAARAGFEALGIDRATVGLKISLAETAREADLAPGVYTVRTVVGPASIDARNVGLTQGNRFVDAMIPGLPSDRKFTAVTMPNPHLVTFVDTVDEAELVALGDWCEAGPALLPARGNVSFVEVRGPADLFVRTYERGVGLTDSCGSAMAASVLSAALTGRVPYDTEIRVFNKGGLVRGRATPERVVTISGNATVLWEGSIEVDPATGTASDLMITRRRDDEAAAWDAAVAALA